MKREKGSALMETVLTIPLFMLLLMGVSDYGRVYYTADLVVQAAQAGAAFGAMNVTNAANNSGMQPCTLFGGQRSICRIGKHAGRSGGRSASGRKAVAFAARSQISGTFRRAEP